jgi:putative membrane protein
MLSDADRERIESAIAGAEAGTAGEIVLVLADRAASYRSVPLAYGLLAALAAPWPLLWFTDLGTMRLLLVQLAACLLAVLAASPKRYRHCLVPWRIRHRRGREAAQRAFESLGLRGTRSRTGILLYLAAAERHAEVIGDAAIAARVDEAEWRAIIADLVAGLQHEGTAEGLLAAIARIGAVLARHVPAPPDNPDELPNRVVVI